MNMVERRFEDVMQILANELECCRSIHSVTTEIGGMIQSDEIESLISKLVEREHLVRQLQCFEEELRSVVARWGEDHAGGDVFCRTAEQIRQLVESIVSLDDEHKNAIVDRRGEISWELRRIREGRTALRTYSGPPDRSGRLVDRVN